MSQTETIVKSSSGGISFAGLLTLLFVVLKATGYINCSWWLVLMPIWITPLIIVAILGLLGLGMAIVFLVAWLLN